MSVANPVFELLHKTKIADVLAEKKQQLITIKPTQPIEQLVKALATNKILSVPVIDKDGSFLGFADYLDVMRHILAATSPEELKRDELENLKIAGRAIALVEVKQIINASARDAAINVVDHDSLASAAKFFASGAHRVAVFDKDNQLSGVLSQSDVVKFLHEHLRQGALKVIGNKTLKQLGFNHQQVDTMGVDAPVLTVLHQMVKSGVSAIPLIENNGNVGGNFSASNLRGLYAEKFPHLLDSARDFLTERSPDSLRVIGSTLDTTLVDAVKDMCESHVHHLWLLDEFRVVGVLSMTDVMKIAVADLSNML